MQKNQPCKASSEAGENSRCDNLSNGQETGDERPPRSTAHLKSTPPNRLEVTAGTTYRRLASAIASPQPQRDTRGRGSGAHRSPVWPAATKHRRCMTTAT